MDCGVARDLSGFWEEAVKRIFDGYRLLVPAIYPEIDMQVLLYLQYHEILIVMIFWLASNYLSLFVGLLLGPTKLVPDSILLQVLPGFLSDLEAGVLREAIICTSNFTHKLKSKLVARFNCNRRDSHQ